MTNLSITKEPSATYKLRNIPEGGWADITIREWDGGGSFSCQSDYGNYMYIWTAIGQGTLREFLCQVNKDYFLNKTHYPDYQIFDNERTCKSIRRKIIKEADTYLSKEDRGELLEELDSLESQSCYSLDEFFYHIESTRITSMVYGDDYHGLPTCEKYNPQCDAFWERVWPHIVKYWKEELNGL